jgi:prepilin-type N-terminal cleavage/methylation domain-containing protein
MSSRSKTSVGRSREAFTLVELLAVITIVGILAAIIIPVVGNARRQSAIGKVTSNLRQSGVLILLYASDHKDELPGRNGGSVATMGTGSMGLNAGATDLIGASDYVQLGRYLVPYTGISLTNTGRITFPPLEDSLGREASQLPEGTAVLWLLNRDMKSGASFYPNLSESVVHPFGTNVGEGSPPMRYRALCAQIELAQTWAMIQSDIPAAVNDYSLSAGSAYKSPLEPVLETYRLALFFDGSVGRIPVGTDLKKPISQRF